MPIYLHTSVCGYSLPANRPHYGTSNRTRKIAISTTPTIRWAVNAVWSFFLHSSSSLFFVCVFSPPLWIFFVSFVFSLLFFLSACFWERRSNEEEGMYGETWCWCDWAVCCRYSRELIGLLGWLLSINPSDRPSSSDLVRLLQNESTFREGMQTYLSRKEAAEEEKKKRKEEERSLHLSSFSSKGKPKKKREEKERESVEHSSSFHQEGDRRGAGLLISVMKKKKKKDKNRKEEEEEDTEDQSSSKEKKKSREEKENNDGQVWRLSRVSLSPCFWKRKKRQRSCNSLSTLSSLGTRLQGRLLCMDSG